MVAGMVCFERDLIDERNKRAEIKGSIIKYWNVNYITEEELKRREAETVLERLKKEQGEDEAMKQAEIEKAYKEADFAAQKWLDDNYNEMTGAFSGTYGQGEVDEVKKEQIDMILHEKETALRGIIDTEKAD